MHPPLQQTFAIFILITDAADSQNDQLVYSFCSSRAVVLNWGPFCPPGDIGSGDTLQITWDKGCYRRPVGGARDSAEWPTVPRAAPGEGMTQPKAVTVSRLGNLAVKISFLCMWRGRRRPADHGKKEEEGNLSSLSINLQSRAKQLFHE